MRAKLIFTLALFAPLLLWSRNPFAITVTLNSTNPTCNLINGKIIVTASGGVAPYTYQIDANPSQSSSVFLFVAAGTHTITVTDATAQTATATVTLTNQYTPPDPPTYTAVPPSGCATQDGSITLNATGGTPPYQYSLDRSNFQPNNTWTNMDAGLFWAAVQDANGCISVFQLITANIPQNCPITVNGVNQSSICFPFKSYLGLMNVSGGVPPYEYSLDGINWQTNNTFFPLPTGIYTVRVRDAAGTIVHYMVGLRDPCPYNFLVNGTVTHAQCTPNGTITVHASQGHPPYTYSLDGVNFQASNIFTGLPGGQYTVTVKDMYDLLATKFFIVNDQGCISLTSTVVNSTCGKANGSITAQGINGIAPYQYAIGTGNFSATNQFNNLLANSYLVKVKDATGAVASATVVVSDIAGPSILPATTTPASCKLNDGSLSIQAQNGTAPFQYSINGVDFQASPLFNNLAAQLYNYIVKDANGCIVTGSANIAEINNLTASASNDMTCEGKSVKITATSNAENFSWSPAISLDDATLLNPVASPAVTTTYTLTASTGNCTAVTAVTITVNKAPIANAGPDTEICMGKDMQLNATGGSIYQWTPVDYLDDPGIFNPTVLHPPAGNYTYSVQVTDPNGCTSLNSSSLQIKVFALKVSIGADTNVHASQPLQLQVKDINNTGFATYSWWPVTGLDDPSSSHPVATLSNEIRYQLTATTAGGCSATDDIVIKVFRDIDIYVPNAFTPNNDGRNDQLKAIPVGIKEFKHLTIYNRGGQVVFKTANSNIGWDGKLAGTLQYGIHVWVAEGTDYKGNAIIRKGTVMVIR